MSWLEGKGWLLVGAVAAIAIPASGAHRTVVPALQRAVPMPWAEVLLSLLIFMACAGIYFRSHWAAAARLLRDRERSLLEIREAVDQVAADLERSGTVMAENLGEVARDPVAATSELYLEGALAHAQRLSRLAGRLRRLRLPSGEESSG